MLNKGTSIRSSFPFFFFSLSSTFLYLDQMLYSIFRVVLQRIIINSTTAIDPQRQGELVSRNVRRVLLFMNCFVHSLLFFYSCPENRVGEGDGVVSDI